MNKRRIAVMLALALLLSGCQLAVPGAETENKMDSDRLTGVFITTDYMDLSDSEAFRDAHVAEILAGSSTEFDAQQAQKVYAVETETGFAFEGLEGMALASYLKLPEGKAQANGYWISQIDEGLSDVQNSYFSGDTAETVQQTATVYVPVQAGEILFYFNPIYQTDTGELYLIPGTGMSMNTDLEAQMTQKLEETSRRAEGGVSKEYSGIFEISVASIYIPSKVTLIQMDAGHRELCRAEYTPGQLPESITPDRNAAYILVEEHYEDGIRRSVNEPESEAIKVFHTLENGLCIQSNTIVIWDE